MVLSLSDPQVVVVWFVWQWGKAGDRPDAVSTQTKVFITFTCTQGPNLIKLQFRAPDSWQLPWMLLRTHRTTMILYHFTVSQGQPSILGNMPSHSENMRVLFPCTQSAVSTEE